MNKGSYESTEWIEEINYKTNLPIPLQKIYDFYMYMKIIKTCSDETVHAMIARVERNGMRIGVRVAINEVRLWRSHQWPKKRRYNK
jgi:hypothetical protein